MSTVTHDILIEDENGNPIANIDPAYISSANPFTSEGGTRTWEIRSTRSTFTYDALTNTLIISLRWSAVEIFPNAEPV